MFVGHYGVSFAAKQFAPVMLGIEKARIVPGITASNPLDLYFMPFTHSLVAAILGSAAALLVRQWLGTWGRLGNVALVVALVVFSHWILDLVFHRPDLPLYDNTAKVGLGGDRRLRRRHPPVRGAARGAGLAQHLWLPLRALLRAGSPVAQTQSSMK